MDSSNTDDKYFIHSIYAGLDGPPCTPPGSALAGAHSHRSTSFAVPLDNINAPSILDDVPAGDAYASRFTHSQTGAAAGGGSGGGSGGASLAAAAAAAGAMSSPENLYDFVSAVQKEAAETEATLATVRRAVADLTRDIAAERETARAEVRRRLSLEAELRSLRTATAAGQNAFVAALEEELARLEAQQAGELAGLAEDVDSFPPLSQLWRGPGEGEAGATTTTEEEEREGASPDSAAARDAAPPPPSPPLTAAAVRVALHALCCNLLARTDGAARAAGSDAGEEADAITEGAESGGTTTTTAAAAAAGCGTGARPRPRKRPRVSFDEERMETVTPVPGSNPSRHVPLWSLGPGERERERRTARTTTTTTTGVATASQDWPPPPLAFDGDDGSRTFCLPSPVLRDASLLEEEKEVDREEDPLMPALPLYLLPELQCRTPAATTTATGVSPPAKGNSPAGSVRGAVFSVQASASIAVKRPSGPVYRSAAAEVFSRGGYGPSSSAAGAAAAAGGPSVATTVTLAGTAGGRRGVRASKTTWRLGDGSSAPS